MIVVDNLPVVAAEKYEKLEGVIRKIFGQIGAITENGLWMPREENGKTKGYAFIEYNTPQVQAGSSQIDSAPHSTLGSTLGL